MELNAAEEKFLTGFLINDRDALNLYLEEIDLDRVYDYDEFYEMFEERVIDYLGYNYDAEFKVHVLFNNFDNVVLQNVCVRFEDYEDDVCIKYMNGKAVNLRDLKALYAYIKHYESEEFAEEVREVVENWTDIESKIFAAINDTVKEFEEYTVDSFKKYGVHQMIGNVIFPLFDENNKMIGYTLEIDGKNVVNKFGKSTLAKVPQH